MPRAEAQGEGGGAVQIRVGAESPASVLALMYGALVGVSHEKSRQAATKTPRVYRWVANMM